jgi:hypothetical protein
MVNTKLFLNMALLLGLVFTGSAFAVASCAENAYQNACANCPFDNETGKMDQSCYKDYQGRGTACVAANYVVASVMHSEGKCGEIDRCAEKLTECKAQASSGNDKADCGPGQVAKCFASADMCVYNASEACTKQEPLCPMLTGIIMLVVGGALLAGFAKGQ